MSNEAEQIAQRQAKLDELVRLGVSPYPNQFDRTAAQGAEFQRLASTAAQILDAIFAQYGAAVGATMRDQCFRVTRAKHGTIRQHDWRRRNRALEVNGKRAVVAADDVQRRALALVAARIDLEHVTFLPDRYLR